MIFANCGEELINALAAHAIANARTLGDVEIQDNQQKERKQSGIQENI